MLISLCYFSPLDFRNSDIPSPIRARAAPVIAPTAIITSVDSIPLVKYPIRKIALYKPITVDNFILSPHPLKAGEYSILQSLLISEDFLYSGLLELLLLILYFLIQSYSLFFFFFFFFLLFHFFIFLCFYEYFFIFFFIL